MEKNKATKESMSKKTKAKDFGMGSSSSSSDDSEDEDEWPILRRYETLFNTTIGLGKH